MTERDRDPGLPQRPPTEMPSYGSGFGVAPYQHVSADQGLMLDNAELSPAASRGVRLAARLIDGLLLLVSMAPGLICMFVMWGGDTRALPLALIGVGALALSIYQWVGIVRSGQTIGKRMTHIRVVKSDGGPVTFVDGVVLREWLPGLLGVIPFLGRLIQIVGYLMIFGNDQKCLHDHIAKTRVVVQ